LESFKELFGEYTTFGLSAGVLIGLLVAVFIVHNRLLALYSKKPGQQHTRQLIMIGIYLFAAILAIILMPLSDETQWQLLSFLAILLSVTIALSSTTLVGNAMAGLMLRSLRNFRPGDYVRVGDHFGRITSINLLHVEIQTEELSLTTLPNLYLATNPVDVLRSSGTMLHVQVSLGYEMPRNQVEAALLKAADETGLTKPFVQILSLEDSSVSYQVSGSMTEIESLIDTRRKLRARVLDQLHAVGIEIGSPRHMNKRLLTTDSRTVQQGGAMPNSDDGQPGPDAMLLDKTAQVEDLDNLKKEYTTLSQDLIGIEQELKEAGPGEQRKPINLRKKKTEARMLRMEKEIAKLEAELSGSQG